jgi:deoxyhypusine monooxygenase
MQRLVTAPSLIEVLRSSTEHAMVRHEAAEALGAIGGTHIEAVLEEFKHDSQKVVEESCLVALNTIDYWSTSEF